MDLINQIGAFIAPFLSGLAVKYPIVVTALVVIGVLRAINKPLFALLRAYVQTTPSNEDDQKLDAVESSSIYKMVCWVLDYLFSVKLVVEKPKA